jgi:hypothetical protein
MPLYFMLHDPQRFHGLLSPALAASWRQRRFDSCEQLRTELSAELSRFVEENRIRREDLFLFRAGPSIPFGRDLWRVLIGEVLLCAAADVPEIPAAVETLRRLLPSDDRIIQAHHGTHPLVFGGGWYRPDNAGYNDRADIARLLKFLQELQPASWTIADFGPWREGESEEQRRDELEFARAALPSLCALHERAMKNEQLIICELM